MKIFKFKCTNCGSEFESNKSHPKQNPCPKCVTIKFVHKIYPVPNIHYKGSGFYSTDKDKK